jgi:integrase/recombinase XerC
MSSEISPLFEFTSELAATTDHVIEAWLAGRNDKTRRGYLSDLKQFAIWAGAPSPEAAVDALMRHGPGKANQVMLAYRAAMKEPTTANPRGLSSACINRRLAAIRSMIKYGRLIGAITWAIDVANEPHEKRKDMRGPDLADTRLLFRAAAQGGNGKSARRDRAILALLFDLGLRRAEVCGLTLADVEMDQEGKPLAIMVTGKGKREKQRLTVPPATAELLGGWIEARGSDAGPLFRRTSRHDPSIHLTGQSVREIVARFGRRAGLRYMVRPHGLRHAAATELLISGRHVQEVQKFTRHASLDMVLAYEDQRHDTAGELAGLLSRRRQEPRS